MRIKPGTAIYFEWLDASSSDGEWKSVKETEDFFCNEQTLVKQVGFYFAEDKDFIWVYAQKIPDKNIKDVQYGHLSKIPKKWIKNLKKLS